MTQAVHAAGGCIVLQLMHCGRIGSYHNKDPEARTSLPARGARRRQDFHRRGGPVEFDMPEALTLPEDAGRIGEYAEAARRRSTQGSMAWSCTARPAIRRCSLPNRHQPTARYYGATLSARLRFVIETFEALNTPCSAADGSAAYLSRQPLQ